METQTIRRDRRCGVSTTILAWHFLNKDRRLRYGTQEVVEVGKTLVHDGPLELCERGLHACVRAIDALQYAPGPIVCRVRMGGEIIHDTDKFVASERTVLAMADATMVLHEFACWCAEGALNAERAAGREPDPRSWAAIETKRRWLRGEATDDELAAARVAAWATAAESWAAADSAWAAANTAWTAAVTAAWTAAVTAAWTAADAARDAQNTELERLVSTLLEGAEGGAE